MTGTRIAEIMRDPEITKFLHKVARRYSSLIEDQEEYIQEGWLRIARVCEDNSSDQFIRDEGRKAIDAARKRRDYHVEKKRGRNLHRIYRDTRKSVDLGRGRYLIRKPEVLDPWYYFEEPAEIGRNYYDFVRFYFYQISIDH